MSQLTEYFDSWGKYQIHIKAKIDGVCHVNNKGWKKLQDYHLDNHLKQLENPHSFLFNVKYFHKGVYKRVPPMAKYYHRYHRRRVAYWDKCTITMKDEDGESTSLTFTSIPTLEFGV